MTASAPAVIFVSSARRAALQGAKSTWCDRMCFAVKLSKSLPRLDKGMKTQLGQEHGSAPVEWPVKTRELIDVHLDSTIWNRLQFREDDVIIANWAKSGCTWLQQIVGQLIFQGAQNVSIARLSPWVEFAVASQEVTLARLEAQTNRRFFKTHLPVDALVYSPHARYLFVGRDGRDAAWSVFNHFRRLSPLWYEKMRADRGNFGPLPDGPPRDFPHFFREWLERDGFPFWPFWEHLQSWWNIRSLPNLMLIHFSELRDRLPHTVRRIAKFLDIPVAEEKWPAILEHCSLPYMRATAARIVPQGDAVFDGGAEAFFAGGGTPGWRAQLSAQDVQRYEEYQRNRLSPQCAAWLACDYRRD
jgi:aryl sulfotransferase